MSCSRADRVEQGSRSTPKLKRNQTNQKYRSGNASIDSFTSLRPLSPGLARTMPNSPVSLSSPLSFSAWHADEQLPSPAYSRFVENDAAAAFASPRLPMNRPTVPPVPSLPRGYINSAYSSQGQPPTHQVRQERSDTANNDDARSLKSWKSSKSWWSIKPKKKGKTNKSEIALPPVPPLPDDCALRHGLNVAVPGECAGVRPGPPRTEGTDHVQAILDLKLGPNCLAVVYNSHESGIMQIYDAAGNEVSYTFGGVEHFESLYELLEAGEEQYENGRIGVWGKVKGWAGDVKWKLNWSRRKTYMIEVWVSKQDQATSA